MNTETKTNILILCIPTLVVLILVLVSQVRFGAALSPQERALLDFHSDGLPQVFHRPPPAVGPIASPIPLVLVSEKDYPRELLTDVAPQGANATAVDRPLLVSLIVVSRNKKFAIINGVVAKEGDAVDQYRVVKIERNRVLLQSKEGKQWLRLE
jgi:hypothetical protein